MAPFDYEGARVKLQKKYGNQVSEEDLVSYSLYPKVCIAYSTPHLKGDRRFLEVRTDLW